MSFFKDFLDEFSRSLREQLNPPSRNPERTPCASTSTDEANSICHNPEHVADWDAHEIHELQALTSGKSCSWVIPVAGNAFLSNASNGSPISNATQCITPDGLLHWTNSEIKISIFVHCANPGSYLVGLRLRAPFKRSSTIRVLIAACNRQQQCEVPQSSEIRLQGTDKIFQVISCGRFYAAQEGYVKIDLVGVQKSGSVFVDASHIILIPDDGESSRKKRSVLSSSPHAPPERGHLKFVSDPDDFYFGRRGPSVHLNYLVPQPEEGYPCRRIEYFYNEVMVPSRQDVMGSYFCAIGFSGGYFGIQVNSDVERRILFSIWSEYNSDDPNEIPRDFKVKMERKGRDVYVGEFGNEGSGAQSYLKYMWKAEVTYKFLVQAKPLDENHTLFSAWFSDGVQGWRLIASFRKPKVSTYLQGLYSFSENFIPEMGHVERYCTFGNQWVWDALTDTWVEVTRIKFTADATARKENRKDVAGGVLQNYGGTGNQFYLRNCGFFSDTVEPDQEFCRNRCGGAPNINFNELP